MKGLWKGKDPGENLVGLDTRPVAGGVLLLEDKVPSTGCRETEEGAQKTQGSRVDWKKG